MERRHITFIFLAASLLLMFNMLNNQNQQPEKPAPENPDIAEVDQDEPAPDKGDENQPDEANPPADKPVEKDKVKYNRQFASLGSADPKGGYRMLVTLDSKGASVHRVELSNPFYLSYEHDEDGGYLGNLAFDETDGKGVRTNVVGPGTPAAEAVAKSSEIEGGLKPGDIITSVNGELVTTVEELQTAMRKTRPGEEIEVEVTRTPSGEGAAPQQITFTIKLRKFPVEVIKPEQTKLPIPNGGPPKIVHHPSAFLTTLAKVGSLSARNGMAEIKGLPSLIDSNWKTTQVSDNEVHFELTLFPSDLEQLGDNRKLRIVKKYRLDKITDETKATEGYEIHFDLELHNESDDSLSVAYRQLGPTGLPLEGWWYAHKINRGWGSAGIRDVTWESENGSQFKMFTVYEMVEQEEEAAKKGSDPQTPLYALGQDIKTKYSGVDAQYFNCSMILNYKESTPTIDLAKGTCGPIGPIDPLYKPRTDCTFTLESRAYPMAAGQTVTQKFNIFAGPKKEDVLAHYGLEDVEYYGWFGFVSKPLLWILHTLYAVLGNYGLAIIVLTLMVRGAMHPISRKQAKNMQIQQALAPEIKRISDQYKDDPEGRLKAQQELFKKHKFNPVGGCLMMFIQLPIFLGLYRGLAVDFELRQAPLIPGISWCSNLAAPDQLWYWGNIMPEFITLPGSMFSLGPYLNILPLVTVVLFLVQQKMFMPPPQDEQQAMQQKVMTFMMIFMGVIFFKVPAGLCIYFITSSIWGIIERKMLPKPKNVPVVIEAKPESIKQPRVRQAKRKK
ncbi:membrane protein insertase YidC [Bremerella cremea]|uniref:Membrane protein insertase YidC n=1 Tax=Bremerella cremea TaxID=1031537 RepID=A0A368KX35_9BACT|nr:YidC/Oxa1 family insertase periplasmic-domain containing protein [Bremerella cremea]RCS54215.1 membrane protein insertase YidC [Bremerella cremea]